MQPVSAHNFLARCAAHEIVLDDRYSEPRCLAYKPYRDWSRFWQFPRGAAAYPSMVQHMLQGVEPWSSCLLWPRCGEWWSGAGEDAALWVQSALMRGAGVPTVHDGALELSHDELPSLVAITCAFMFFAWNVDDDLFIIPSHGRAILYVDHHRTINAEFSDDETMQRFIAHMERRKYILPTEVPDATFKRPSWMPPASG